MRAGLCGLIAGAPDMSLAGTASDGVQAIEAVATLTPQVVLMDLSMPVMDGISATRHITEEHPDVQVLVLSSFSDQDRVLEAMDAGAIGYVLKDTDPHDLLEAIRSAARGHSPLDPQVARTILHARRHTAPVAELTEREQ